MTLSVRGLTFAYGEHRVLDGVDLDLHPGELCALFGPNGSGKSTLYRCLLGHLRHGGTVTLDGVDLGRLGPAEVARRVSYVPQQHTNPFPFTVLDMVLMGRTPHLGGCSGPARPTWRSARGCSTRSAWPRSGTASTTPSAVASASSC